MTKVTTLAIYWKSRCESIESCATGVVGTFSRLRECSPLLANWYGKASSSDLALSTDCVSNLELEQLVVLMKKGVNKRDADGSPIYELGYSLGLWNQRSGDEAAGLRVKCGLNVSNANLSNAVVLNLPKTMADFDAESNSLLSDLLIGLVHTWNPDWGAVFDINSSVTNSQKAGTPFLDQLLWINERIDAALFKEDIGEVIHIEDGRLYKRN